MTFKTSLFPSRFLASRFLPRNILNFKIISPRELGALKGSESQTARHLREAELELHKARAENGRLTAENRELRLANEGLRGQSEQRRRAASVWENRYKTVLGIATALNRSLCSRCGEIAQLKAQLATAEGKDQASPISKSTFPDCYGKPLRDEDDNAAQVLA
ncbi:MAG TPA: hypothetical protein VGB77_10230 [Abditibacteriaceae bacterium]|jgi:FtsZ-binding cell division protein ZapB